MGKKKNAPNGLGKAMIKDRFSRNKKSNDSFVSLPLFEQIIKIVK